MILNKLSPFIFFIVLCLNGIQAFGLYSRRIFRVHSSKNRQFSLSLLTSTVNIAGTEPNLFANLTDANRDQDDTDDDDDNDIDEGDQGVNDACEDVKEPFEDSLPELSHDLSIELQSSGQLFPKWNGSEVRIGIVKSRTESDIVNDVFQGLNQSFIETGVIPAHIFTSYAPSIFELPMIAKFLSASKRFDVIVCLGALIRNESINFEYLAQASSHGIMRVALESFTPIINGVLIASHREEASRLSTGVENQGILWGKAAVEMGLARMSALGVDKEKKKQPNRPFSTFNTTHSHNSHVTNDSSQTVKHIKKFGF